MHSTLTSSGSETRVIASYDASAMLNAPFKVLLCDSVRQCFDVPSGKLLETIVPDPEGLVKAVAQARVLHPHKLNGRELRFLRSALGMKSKDLARAIAVTPEHMSRWESENKPLSLQSEMLVRIYTFVSTLPFTSKRKAEAEIIGQLVGKVFDKLSVVAAHAIEDEIILQFTRRPLERADGCSDDGLWDHPLELKAA